MDDNTLKIMGAAIVLLNSGALGFLVKISTQIGRVIERQDSQEKRSDAQLRINDQEVI